LYFNSYIDNHQFSLAKKATESVLDAPFQQLVDYVLKVLWT